MNSATRGIAYLLALAALINPIAMNAFNPAMPDVVRAFNSDVATVQLTFTLYLFTLAIAQLFGGALADRWGRRPLFLAGLLIHLSGSLVAYGAPSVEQLIAGRVLQALGGGFSLLLVRTIVLDLYQGIEAGRRLSLLTMFVALGQGFSPTIGGYLNHVYGWSSIFLFSLAVVTVIAACVAVFLPETRDTTQKASSAADSLRGYLGLLANRRYLAYLFSSVFLAVAYFCFASSMPYVVDAFPGGSSAVYGQWFLWVSGGFFFGSLALNRLPGRWKLHHAVLLGYGFTLIGAVAMVAGLLLSGPGYWVLFLPMAVLTFGRGLVQPAAQTLAVTGVEQSRGVAVGLLGFIQIMVGSATSQLMPYLLQLGVGAIVLLIATSTVLGLICYGVARRV